MKLGQVMSFLDVGLVPEEFREDFQAKLAELRDAAPNVSFKDMKKVIESEYGERIEDVFESFDPVPIAAASIGQVYQRAPATTAAQVAVKVQYPGVDDGRPGRHAEPRGDPAADEARGAGARPQGAGRGDPRAHRGGARLRARGVQPARASRASTAATRSSSCPRSSPSLSREKRGRQRVRRGPRLRGDEAAADQAERDRIGEIIFRFYFGCMYRHHQFSGDPHPGNCLLLDDGRMAFLDFGLFKRIPATVAEFELETQRLGVERDGRGLIETLHRGGFIGDTRTTRRERSSRCSTTSRGGTHATRRSSSSRRSPPRS